jgi:hypothetical protein
MKKSLYLTSALVAAGVLALGSTSSMAAGKKMKAKVSGSYEALIGYAKQAAGFSKTNTGTASTSYNEIDVKTDSEIHISGSTKTDSGLTVGMKVELETDQAGGGIDHSFLTVGGGFGTIALGSTAAAAAIMAVQAPNTGALGIAGGDTNGWIVMPAGNATTLNQGMGYGGHDGAKVRWTSKAFSGFSVGGSYTPSWTNQNNMPANGGNLGTEKSTIDMGVKYAGKMGKNAIKASLTYWAADAGVNSLDAYHIGVSSTMGSVTIGASMDDVSSAGTAAGGGSVSGTAASLDAEGVNVGASWAQGGTTLSLNYYQKEMERASATDGEDSMTKWTLGAKYAMGPGVDFVGTVQNAKWSDQTGVATLNNKGTIIVGGISVGF